MVAVKWMGKVDRIDSMSGDLVRIHLAADPVDEFYVVAIDDVRVEDLDD